MRAGSTPSSLSWFEDREKRASQEVNLEVCFESCRPMRVRNVAGSGTKGVGEGIGARCWRWRTVVSGFRRDGQR